MDNVELGKRIKEARIARKMTQSEVVGDFITRNMLSQIESGNAAPSVKTLIYLSQVLDLQLADSTSNSSENALLLLIEAKECLQSCNYSRVMQIAAAGEYPSQLSDEFYAIFSMAALRLSQQLLEKENFEEAADLAKKAMRYSSKGLYANETLKSESIMVLHASAEKLSDYYKTLSKS